MRNKLRRIMAPLSGRVVRLEEVPDEVFSQRVLGDGAAVIPEDGRLLSPVDGRVASIAKTGHAYGFAADDGLEVLVHVGLDTVALGAKASGPLCRKATASGRASLWRRSTLRCSGRGGSIR